MPDDFEGPEILAPVLVPGNLRIKGDPFLQFGDIVGVSLVLTE